MRHFGVEAYARRAEEREAAREPGVYGTGFPFEQAFKGGAEVQRDIEVPGQAVAGPAGKDAQGRRLADKRYGGLPYGAVPPGGDDTGKSRERGRRRQLRGVAPGFGEFDLETQPAAREKALDPAADIAQPAAGARVDYEEI